MHILVTGGAGFIGSHLVDALISRGHRIRVLDRLDAQVHGEDAGRPGYLHPEAELLRGDVRDPETVQAALQGVDAVFYQAAAVGVGQSMYEIRRYVDYNTMGAATFLEAVVNHRRDLRKMVVASSMSIYGEGAYHCDHCGEVYPRLRPPSQLRAKQWEMRCPACELPVTPRPTRESKPLYPTSVYAITKRDHEELFLSVGRAYGIPTVALRYFNVYGPRQALSNPYTGVAAIFSTRLLAGKPPVIFEDGRQTRDFVHVRDIVQANLLVLDDPRADYEVFNVGTGRPVSIAEVAEALRQRLRPEIEPVLTGEFREGDIRHCVADISKIQALGYQPSVRFEDGMAELVEWVRGQHVVDRFDQAKAELEARGLTKA